MRDTENAKTTEIKLSCVVSFVSLHYNSLLIYILVQTPSSFVFILRRSTNLWTKIFITHTDLVLSGGLESSIREFRVLLYI
jgi:hypothetical protein